jgi:hypothetical protein
MLAVAAGAEAAPSKNLWPRWEAHDASSEATIDHSAWTWFLERYRQLGPDGVSRIDYGAVSAEDRQRLADYIDGLTSRTISDYNRDVQFAYWVNLYNALTVDVVLEHYPVATIRDIDISGGWFTDGPWDKQLVDIEGEAVTLNDIEHRILRPIWDDPRIHYAVNCASVGCPNLQPQAFTAANHERLLERGAEQYVNHPRGAKFDGDTLIVSSIYAWFQADFGGNQRGVIEHLRQYADDDLADRLKGRKGYYDHRYDWSLNDVAE